ncbi:succinate dehydrogenase assembly factor 3, mitochondrial [Anoplophora glabripennis]|uniref:succinate dehydrogenase assembly factor 3, mitochondrial n=1 Tax=Anoplophora glabripennis TaxID=217634 RepID=UPI0008741858|nr:succinate dehydrogenase assembly factor 3, mitochondrial [Anoplophora glabripennis]
MNFTSKQRVRILYKTILKLHRGLPKELQVLGTNYAKDEFKRHKTCSTEEAEVFVNEWTNYAISLAEQLGLRGPHTGTKRLGSQLAKDDIDQLRDEQVHQLYELMEEATKTSWNESPKR